VLVFSLLGPSSKLSFQMSHNWSPFGSVVGDNGSGIGASDVFVGCVPAAPAGLFLLMGPSPLLLLSTILSLS
jgi:hypothetical protein